MGRVFVHAEAALKHRGKKAFWSDADKGQVAFDKMLTELASYQTIGLNNNDLFIGDGVFQAMRNRAMQYLAKYPRWQSEAELVIGGINLMQNKNDGEFIA